MGGGKPGGALFQRKSGGKNVNAYNVVFNTVSPKISKYFSFKTYHTQELAYEAAVLFQIQKSAELGLTRNMYRKLPDGIYWNNDENNFPVTNNSYEVHIKCKGDDMYMLVDEEDLSYVDKYTICVTKSGTNKTAKYYAETSFKGPRGTKERTKKFHKDITGFDMVDHINRNPLDNRRCNLRESNYKLNNNNRGMNVNSDPEHILGVRFRDGSWQARIKQDGVEYVERFPVIIHGDTEAKNLAILARKKFNDRFNCKNC